MRCEIIRDRILKEIHPRHYPYLLSIYMLEFNDKEITDIIKHLEK